MSADEERVEWRYEFVAMGGPCEFRLRAEAGEQATRLAQAGIAEVRRIEARYSRFRSDSLIGQINARAGTGQWTALDAEASALFDFADALWRSSEGRFDLTSGPLSDLWRAAAGRGVPEREVLTHALGRVGWPGLERDRPGHRVRLSRSGMRLDLGGIGKEYAVDRAAQRMQALVAAQAPAVSGGLVNLGGDIRAWGGASPWSVGIAHPRQPAAVVASTHLQTEAVATSGDYERGFVLEGRRYSHLIDARTGWPVEGPASVSVIAPTCAAAGGVATLAMLHADAADAFVRAQGLEALICDAEGHPLPIGETSSRWRMSTPNQTNGG